MQKRAAGIIIQNNKVLLMRRAKEGREYFVFPGGGVENNETSEQAVIREIKEELGLEIKIKKPIFAIENQGRQEYYFLIKDFIGESRLGGEEKERMNKNNQYHPIWFDLSEAINLPNLYPELVKQKLKEIVL